MVHKSYAAQEDDDGDNDGEIKGRTMMMIDDSDDDVDEAKRQLVSSIL